MGLLDADRRIARRPRRRALARLVLPALALLLPSCAEDGHFTVLGYSTRPNYDTRYKTVRVNIFKSKTFWSVVPTPGLEMDLARAIVRQIEEKTPYKCVGAGCDADTEIGGTLVNFTKGVLNANQLNYPREVET